MAQAAADRALPAILSQKARKPDIRQSGATDPARYRPSPSVASPNRPPTVLHAAQSGPEPPKPRLKPSPSPSQTKAKLLSVSATLTATESVNKAKARQKRGSRNEQAIAQLRRCQQLQHQQQRSVHSGTSAVA